MLRSSGFSSGLRIIVRLLRRIVLAAACMHRLWRALRTDFLEVGMHSTVLSFFARKVTDGHIAGERVLEVGSYDVNGSVRPYVESLLPAEYLGVDQCAGPRVDRVVNCMDLVEVLGSDWDVVISTEMLEHVEDWRGCMYQLAGALKAGGLLILTTRSPGFPYHPYPIDCWRYTNAQMRSIIEALNFEVLTLEDDPQPGVFVLARKLGDAPVDALEGIEVNTVR